VLGLWHGVRFADSCGGDFEGGFHVAVGAFEGSLVAIAQGGYGGAGYPVEVKGFTAPWTRQAGDVMWAIPWQKNH